MATPLTLRRDVAALTGLAAADLSQLWRGVETALALETALRDTLPGLVDAYGAAAATIAADWYDDLRDEREIPGRFSAMPAEIPDAGTQALVGWALAEATDVDTFRVLVDGGTQRRIANFSRQTVMASSLADPQAHGWQRTGAGDCDFCAMLIGRGAVYTEATADFQAHDHCSCSASPSW